MSGTSEKSFRVVICLCPARKTQSQTVRRSSSSRLLNEPRAFVERTHLNRVMLDTGKCHKPHMMDFDDVLNEEASRRDVYESTTKSLVDHLMQGFNGCVIICGTLGSSVTQAMEERDISSKHRDIITNAAEDIFHSAHNASHFRIRVSFYHIFNEKIYDLLDPNGGEVMWVRDCEEVVRRGGLKEVEVSSLDDLLYEYRRGSALKHTGISKGNFPSRSHMVFNIIVINTTNQSSGGVFTVSKLTLVDLASSAKPYILVTSNCRKSFNTADEHSHEAKMMKRSLTIFRNVIFALGSGGSQHVPYRESKLTRALKDCLGGNCRTCLVLTLSRSPSICEALTSLQFASRAMAIPSRPIYTSLVNYMAEKPCSSHKNGKNGADHLKKEQIRPPVGLDRRSKTCLLPILRRSSSSSEPKLSSCQAGDATELRSFLPHLEKPAPAESGGQHGRASQVGLEKNRTDVFHDPGGKEKARRGLDFSVVQRRSVERVSTSSLDATECLNCCQERKIRKEYDKIIIQARRDKDALRQKVADLENELMKNVPERHEREQWEKTTTHEEPIKSVSASPVTETAEKCFQKETDGLREEVSVCGERERILTHTLNTEKARLTQNVQELTAQLHSTSESNKRLQSAQENWLAEQQSMKEEHERFREKVLVSLSRLKAEKAELMSLLQETTVSYEKECSDNASLRQRLKSFLKEVNSASFTMSSSAETHTSHTVTENTEVIVVSRHVSQQNPSSVSQGSECGGFSGCEDHQHHLEEEFAENSQTTCSGGCEHPLYKQQILCKQLRREHSLLLDVMLVLYRREWFLQDAIPYVRRTLRKCGLRPEDMD